MDASPGGDFLGRPRGRSVDCKFNRFAVRFCHDLSPNGEPPTAASPPTPAPSAVNARAAANCEGRPGEIRRTNFAPIANWSGLFCDCREIGPPFMQAVSITSKRPRTAVWGEDWGNRCNSPRIAIRGRFGRPRLGTKAAVPAAAKRGWN